MMRPFVAGVFVLLISCTGIHHAGEVTIDRTQGVQKVSLAKENFSITYFGDYWFHPYNRKTTLNWDHHFARMICSFGHPLMLCCCHTTMSPYCSSLGVIYRNAQRDSMVNRSALRLKNALRAVNFNDTTEFLGINNVRILSYEIKNDRLNVRSSYVDYYFEEKGNVYRFVFWSRETASWLGDESSRIMKTARFDYSGSE